MPTLTIQLPNLPPVEHVLRDETMTIGRMKGNTIALDDPSVSISHAKITRVNGDFFLKDLNSTNGTMLNGQSIVEVRLRDGDQIKFGEVIAYFRGEHPAPSAAVPAQTPQPPAASPPAPSTTFVSKRLVTQASQISPASPVPAAPAQKGNSHPRSKGFPIVPVIGISAAIIVGATLVWMFVGGGETPKVSAAHPGATTTQTNFPAAPKVNPAQQLQNTSIAGLVKLLKSPNPAERRNAATELHARGTDAKDAVPQLREALNDPDADVRMWAALALINNKSYDQATIPILIQTLRQPDPMLRQVASLSLAVVPYEGEEKRPVVEALTKVASKDTEADVRDAASSALKIIAPESAPAEK